MTERQTAVRRYACPECGRAFGFDRLKGPRIMKHVLPQSNPPRRERTWCPGSGMLPVRAKAVAP